MVATEEARERDSAAAIGTSGGSGELVSRLAAVRGFRPPVELSGLDKGVSGVAAAEASGTAAGGGGFCRNTGEHGSVNTGLGNWGLEAELGRRDPRRRGAMKISAKSVTI